MTFATFKFRKFGFLALWALVAPLGCSDKGGGADVDVRVSDATRPLVFLTHPTTPPCSYIDVTGAYAGTEVELARKIAAKMGRALTIESVDFEAIIPRLKAGTADFGIATITITAARSRDVDFSAPYAFGGSTFLYRAGGVKPRMSQLASLRVAAESGTTEDLYLCRHGCDPIRFTDIQEAVVSLEKGVVDAIFFDEVPLKAVAAKSGGRFTVTPLETRDGYGVAVDKRRPDVLAAANAVIAGGGVK